MEDENTNKINEEDDTRTHKLIVVVSILFGVLAILFIIFIFFLKSNDVTMAELFPSSDDSPSEVSEVMIAHKIENGAQREARNELNANTPIENKNINDFTPIENESHGLVAPLVTDRSEKLAIIKTTMQSNYTAALKCRQRGGEILSSEKSGSICSGPTPSGGNIVWVGPTFCGDSYYDTTWTVFNGDTDQWDFTMECKGFTECNGPEGAICNAQGCTFHCADDVPDGATIVEIDL